MTVAPHVPPPVASAAADLADEQWRVAGLLAAAGARGAWEARLPDDARWELARRGHFPRYAAELDWTPREVAGHLRDSALVFTGRLRRLCREDEPLLPDFATTDPGRLAGCRRTDPGRLVGELQEAQAGLLRAVAAIDAAELGRAGVHEVDGRLTVADVLDFLPGHQRDHAAQLAALLGR